MDRFWNFFGQNNLKINLSKGHFYKKKMKYLQTEASENGPFLGKTGACQTARNGPMLTFIGDRVTESQTLKGTQYTGVWNFFVPDFNKLPYSLHSQGDNCGAKAVN